MVVMWGLPAQHRNGEPKKLALAVRYRNGDEETVSYRLKGRGGHVIYELRGPAYRDAGGIACYRAVLTVDSQVIEEWRHQVWVDRIVPKELMPQTVATASPRAS